MFPEEFHDLGKRLLDSYSKLCSSGESPSSIEECVFRTIIDRAYYSAFLTAREWLINDPEIDFEPSRTGEDHHEVRHILAGSDLPNASGLAGRLGRLKKERGQASYDISGGYSAVYEKSDVQRILNNSEKFIDSINSQS